MEAALIRLVWQRANRCCEYCRMCQDFDRTPFEIDHIIAGKHQGPTVAANLALSCFYCNSFKGSDISSLDRQTGKLKPLFNPINGDGLVLDFELSGRRWWCRSPSLQSPASAARAVSG
jgi:5-methylcytosine-specific restriction endonuclease McrA